MFTLKNISKFMYSSDIFSLLCLDSHYKSYCIYHPGPWSCCKKRKWSFCIQSYAELFIEYCVKLQKNKKQQNKKLTDINYALDLRVYPN